MRTLAAFLVVLALALATPLRPAAAAEEILRYDQIIEMSREDRLRVTETITVRAEGTAIRRGIFRDFPLRFEDAAGRLRQVGFEVISVRRNGETEPFSVNRDRRGARVMIGDPDRLLRTGLHTYEIVYETTRQIRRFESHDELYWNVTGTEWQFPILEASARVSLPGGTVAERTNAFTGPLGAQGGDWTLSRVGGDLLFETTAPLAPGEGLTIVVALPAGTILPPSAADEAEYLLDDNRLRLFAFGGTALVFAYYLIAWWRIGRDPPPGTIIPLFEPPVGISPALANLIDRRGLSSGGLTALSAACMSLAVRGLVTIDLGEPLTLTRTAAPKPRGLPPDEATVLSWLETRGSGPVAIARSNGPAVQTLARDFRSALTRETQNEYFRSNAGWAVLGVLLSIAAVGAVIATGTLTELELVVLLPFTVASIFVAAGAASIRNLWSRGFSVSVLFGTVLIGLTTGFGALIGGALVFAMTASGEVEPVFPGMIAALIVLNGVFFALIGAPTTIGRAVMDKLDGLKLFMSVAEKDRLNMPGLPPVTPTRYETLLPYAVALGVEERWTEALQSELARAGTEATVHRPGFITGPTGSSWSDRLAGTAGAMSTAFASAVPPPKSSSSGFSSGGGSGGGGGGGGGGGW